MKHYCVFINTSSIKKLKFIELKILSKDGDYAEISPARSGDINITVYKTKFDKGIPWVDNMKAMENSNTYNIPLLGCKAIDEEHILTAINYLEESKVEKYKIEYKYLTHESPIQEMYEFLIFQKNESFTSVRTTSPGQ